MHNKLASLALSPLLLAATATAAGTPEATSVHPVAATINGFMDAHWQLHAVTPAEPADDAIFLRRITLDLLGRIPTVDELDKFLADEAADKRQQLIARLVQSPEFALHFGNVFDQLIQGPHAGRSEFVDYLRRSFAAGKAWDRLFRELMLGPWDDESSRAANQFLDRRARDLDSLTADTARTFFGVDISCAKCHDHPLVPDWSQEHFYGMAAFLNRTTGGKGKVGEKQEGEIKFLGADGSEQVARMMFLSGTLVDEPQASGAETPQKRRRYSRREQLVNAALADKTFFSRAIVNRIWAYFLGRGLLDPVDQMHSANEPAVPGLLEQLAEDFVRRGYDLRALITGLVSSRVYQLSSRWDHGSSLPDEKYFAVAQLRPLSPRQLAFSLLLATGNETLVDEQIPRRLERLVGVSGLARMQQYLTIEQRAAKFWKALDPPRPGFQSSAAEALFMSNNRAVQQLVVARTGNLCDRLSKLADLDEIIESAVRTALTRTPRSDELQQFAAWFGASRPSERPRACEQLVWALVTSAEFRFNH